MSATGDGYNFYQQSVPVLKLLDRDIPEVTVRYKDLTIEVDAAVGLSDTPSLWHSSIALVNWLLLRSRASRRPLKIFDGVSGMLYPGRLTLLLGPPSSGKTIFMKTLAGRTKPHAHLRVTGSVDYNGQPIDSFNVNRTAGFVDQYTYHIGALSVMEMLQFAYDCLTDHNQTEADAEVLLAKLEALEKKLGEENGLEGGRISIDPHGSDSGSGKDGVVPNGAQHSRAGADNEALSQKRAALAPHPSASLAGVAAPLSADFLRDYIRVLKQAIKPYLVMKTTGLSHAADTFVGDAMHRGISGGERRRATLAEVLVGPQNVLFMDEISTGLDSATAYSVIRSLRNACHALKTTYLVSLLQPPPEVMRLFDDVILITDGLVIYHGPMASVLDFFANQGFVCPPRKDPGSFLQEVTTPLGQMSYATDELLHRFGIPVSVRDPVKLLRDPPARLLVSVAELARAFWVDTEEGRGMLAAVEAEDKGKHRASGASSSFSRRRYANGVVHLVRTLFRRQVLLNLVRSRGFIIVRSLQSAVMGLIVGSLYNNIEPGPDTWRTVVAFCLVTAVVVMMMPMPQMAIVFATKRVFFKHRDDRLFPSWAYVLSFLLTQLVPSTLETIMFCVPAYFLVDFYRSAGRFFTFLFIAWSGSNAQASMVRLLGFCTPDLTVGNLYLSLVMLLLMITNGFVMLKPEMPDYIVWIYYINPLAYTIKGITINELQSPQWAIPVNQTTWGDVALEAFGIPNNTMWIWGSVIYLWGFVLIMSALSALALIWFGPAKPRASVEEDRIDEVEGSGWSSFVHTIGAQRSSRSGGAVAHASIASQSSVADGERPPLRHVVVPFTPITLVCRNIRYYVPDPAGGKGANPNVIQDTGDAEIDGKLRLLNDVSFYAEPTDLIALMGGSGAGKTTAHGCGTVGLVRGDILVNGHPKEQSSWARVVGYVEQTDIHSAALTVRESLLFSARMRLEESIPMHDVESIVEETMRMVELDKLQWRVIGSNEAGLSLEQLKRVSIAVELVANPSVVFMDEPTSGLDARSAVIVMRAVRNVADSHRTVMVTIHQPSMEIFEAFDTILLLQRGGQLTYFGPLGKQSCELVKYLESQPGVEPLRPGYNPATWMLEVTGGSMSTTFRDAGQNFPELYAASALKKQNDERAEALVAKGAAEHEPLSFATRYAASKNTQRKWLIRKFYKLYWYTPEPMDLASVQSVSGLIFSMALFLGIFNCMAVMPLYFQERIVFYRERSAGMYAPGPYILATALAEVPYLVLQTLLLVSITYWMVGFQAVAWKFFFFLILFFLNLTMFTVYGQFLTYLTPNQLMSMMLAALSTQLWTFFNGFPIPYPEIPEGWKWMNRISPSTWTIYGLACSQLCDVNVEMIDLAGNPTTLPEFLKDFFDWEENMVWWCVLFLFAYCIFFGVTAALLLTKVSYLRR
ncbi:hypothetical protein QBZ16_005002 [Prototheca wickerhamii]|uniref:ABC transporter domain-containing protein n=1 Tax=Prototheca wickerhamii TaxID=3111 RepID=A0AAD9IEE6_PROWI|nr:hypothetical protein QBZ16_005002 [Prototheca wickerhamii]